MSTTRLEAFSDGVFAIAATLLVLDLRVRAPSGQLAAGLGREWPHYATFVVSFLTIGVIWVNHHAQFARVARVDRTLLFINLGLLMFVVLIPFPTGLLAGYLHAGSDQHVAAAVYAGTLLAMGVCFAATWAYAARRPDLMHRPLERREVLSSLRRNAWGQGAYAAATGLAFLSAPASLALCGLTAIYYVLPGRVPQSS